jgi:hypothetical protein
MMVAMPGLKLVANDMWHGRQGGAEPGPSVSDQPDMAKAEAMAAASEGRHGQEGGHQEQGPEAKADDEKRAKVERNAEVDKKAAEVKGRRAGQRRKKRRKAGRKQVSNGQLSRRHRLGRTSCAARSASRSCPLASVRYDAELAGANPHAAAPRGRPLRDPGPSSSSKSGTLRAEDEIESGAFPGCGSKLKPPRKSRNPTCLADAGLPTSAKLAITHPLRAR